jgi:hypothetical protein
VNVPTVNGSPGSHPHSDRPNWQPGDDDADELQRQKLGDLFRNGGSERQIAKALGWPRTKVQRLKAMTEIPEPLRERLGQAWKSGAIRRLSVKSWAAIGRLIREVEEKGDDARLLCGEVERCPNCGHTLRVRHSVEPAAFKIIADWYVEQEARES